MKKITSKDTNIIFNNSSIKRENNRLIVCLEYNAAFGMGEKYDCLNHKGFKVINKVEEQFCFQNEKTYCPSPFFFTDTNFGLYVDTDEVTSFSFEDNKIIVELPRDADAYLFEGSPKNIISEYMKIHGQAVLPPEWSFGVWASANRWNKQSDVEDLLNKMKEYDYHFDVIVLEAWSDESTFYIFNGAKYDPKENGEAFNYNDFDFKDSPWPNPKEMIQRIHDAKSHLVLWQIPVYKKQEANEPFNNQNKLDIKDALNRKLCVFLNDGKPYTIPDGHWFSGSYIPDFINPNTFKTWFDKRKYLLDIGVDGFKTDGGEFIYRDDIKFYDGCTGMQGINKYINDYTSSYSNFIGKDKVLFSRAGYAKQHTLPIHWAGDQQSVNSELKSALNAGLSASLSGMIFWSFDAAGFAGELPSLDLYRRAMAFACFCPIMQWHSEPEGGQFKDIMKGIVGNNERSPWNMASHYNCPELIDEMRNIFKIRESLKPYLIKTAKDCVKFNKPMMRPLIYDFEEDMKAIKCEDEYMLGNSLLVAPLLEENATSRNVYLPKGKWKGYFDGQVFDGNTTILSKQNPLPVFIRLGYEDEL